MLFILAHLFLLVRTLTVFDDLVQVNQLQTVNLMKFLIVFVRGWDDIILVIVGIELS